MELLHIMLFFMTGPSLASADKILVVPIPFKCDVTTITAMSQDLSDNGHHVTILLADTFKEFSNEKGLITLFFSTDEYQKVIEVMVNKALSATFC